MNITNPQQCIEKWESDFIKTGDDSLIPPDDRERVLYELDQLYNELYDLVIFTGGRVENEL